MKTIRKTTVALFVGMMFMITGIMMTAGTFGQGSRTVADAQTYQSVQTFSGGLDLGTATDPFLIGDLATLRARLLSHANIPGTHFSLTNDIDLFATSVQWVSIPNFAAGSVFNGNGFALNRFTQTAGTGNRGMFDNFNGTMKNVNFTNVNLNGGSLAGVITGRMNIPAGVSVLIDNVRLVSGSMGQTTGHSGRTGGFIGSLGSSGTTVTNRASLTITNSSNTLSLVRGGNCTGGFIGIVGDSGNVANNMDITIRNSFHDGNLQNNSNIVAGIIAGYSSATNITTLIENVFVRGTFHASGSHVGGIVAFVSGTNMSLTIRNSFVDANMTSNSAPRGGIFGGGGSGTVIENSFFNSDRFNHQISAANAIAGGSVTAANMATSGTRNTTQMQSQAFVDQLNAGSDNWILGANGPELRVLAGGIFLTLDANSGQFADGETRLHKDWDIGHTFIGDELDAYQPTKIGYEFTGWNTFVDGSGVQLDIADLTASAINRTFFAQWKIKDFELVPFNEIDQSLTFRHDMINPNYIETITIYQDSGFARVYHTNIGANTHFAGWHVLRSGGDVTVASDWVNLGTGELINFATREYRLHFADIIDANFIYNFGYTDVNGEHSITFRALFAGNAPIEINIDAPTFAERHGSIRINGVNRAWGDTQFPHGTTSFQLEIIPNDFHILSSITVGGNPISIGTPNANGVWSVTVNPTQGNVQINFGLQSFNLFVGANHAGAFGGVSDITAQSIRLGDSIDGITIGSVTGYRLISPSAQNIRIWNVQTQRYDYDNAIDGEITLNITQEFLTNYLRHIGGGIYEIRVVAVFVRQFAIDVNNTNPDMGNTVLLVNGEVAPSGVTYFDEGSEITVLLQPNANAQINAVTRAQTTNHAQTEIRFALGDTTIITVGFELRQFAFTVQAMDTDGRFIDSSEITTGWTAPGTTNLINEGDTIEFSFAEVAGNEGLYRFRGWYVIRNGVPVSISNYAPTYVADVPNSNVTNFAFSTTFAQQFADGFNLRVIAKFEMVHSIEFDVTGPNNAGTFTAEILEFDGSSWIQSGTMVDITTGDTLPAGTRLLITASPNANFRLVSIDGLNAGEIVNADTLSVVIIVDGLRFITVNFAPRQFQITTAMTLRGNGTMQTGTMTVGYGDVIMLTFIPSSGFELSTWTINGRAISEFGNDIRIENNTVRIRINTNTIAFLEDNNFRINNEIATIMNSTFMFGMLTAAIAIPLIVLIITMMMLSNARKKKQYAELQAKRQQGAVMMGQSEALKKLREDINK